MKKWSYTETQILHGRKPLWQCLEDKTLVDNSPIDESNIPSRSFNWHEMPTAGSVPFKKRECTGKIGNMFSHINDDALREKFGIDNI